MWACITWLRCHDQSASSAQSWWDEHKAAKSSFTLTPRWRRLKLRQTPSLLSSSCDFSVLTTTSHISPQDQSVKLYPHRQPRVQTRWLRPLNGRRCLQRLLRINSLSSFLGTYEKYICIALCSVHWTDHFYRLEVLVVGVSNYLGPVSLVH